MLDKFILKSKEFQQFEEKFNSFVSLYKKTLENIPIK
jgi:hypothetical protein